MIGGNFPGGSFPDTEANICKEFSSVRAYTLIFIRRIFTIQAHNLRVYSRTNNIFFYGVEIFRHPLVQLIGHVSSLIGYI